MDPTTLKYTTSHEWAGCDEAGTVTVGISKFACDQLGDIVFVELPEAGTAVTAGQPFGVIESVKAAVDLNSPVSGEVVEANEAVTDDFDQISQDPCGEGWMIKIKASDTSELDALMDAAAYDEFVAGQPDH